MQKRPSIKEIIANWQKLSLFSLLLLLLVALTTLNENNSFGKSTNLLGQKQLINEIANIGRDDLELASIQYRGKSTQLMFEHEKLVDLNSYDLMGQFMLGYSNDYMEDLETLKQRTLAFNDAAAKWYDEDDKQLKERERKMQASRYALLSHIDRLLFKNIGYAQEQYQIQRMLIYATLLVTLLVFSLYFMRFRTIFRDIHSLYSVETKDSEYQIVTDEIDVISKRMSRKPAANDNPAMIDPITEINNYKGLLFSFANRKVKDGGTTAICIFEIDDFKELDRQYPKSFTQMVLKKIAFMLSLHEQHTDILARTDYSQFAIVFHRNSLDLAFKECEHIRKSVEETAFKIPKGGTIHLTISGGLVQKNSNVALEDTIQVARDTLAKGVSIEKNSIKQPKDVVSA
jgi:diguanylate cyclase (GGDEF)-like protein